jgi:hypothetical protein
MINKAAVTQDAEETAAGAAFKIKAQGEPE